MPWIIKALFILVKSRRGRKLLLTAGLTVLDLAQRDQARKFFAKARTSVIDPTVRQTLKRKARRAAEAIRP